MLPTLKIIDDAVSAVTLQRWQAIVLNHRGTQSTGYREEEYSAALVQYATYLAPGIPDDLHALVREHVHTQCLHVLVFAIEQGMDTEMHRDVGEYAALFYPFTNPIAPLRIDRGNGEECVEVIENRLVLIDVTTIGHQQVVPTDTSVRYSVAFKFARPEG